MYIPVKKGNFAHGMTSYFLTKIESFGKIFHKVYKNLIITYMYLRNFLKKKKEKSSERHVITLPLIITL